MRATKASVISAYARTPKRSVTLFFRSRWRDNDVSAREVLAAGAALYDELAEVGYELEVERADVRACCASTRRLPHDVGDPVAKGDVALLDELEGALRVREHVAGGVHEGGITLELYEPQWGR